MAISIDWANRVIFVPKLDLQLVQSVPSEIRELDLNSFRLELKNLEDSEDGMSFPTTHNHNTLTQLGGVTLARVVELINDYTVTFEDGQYAVNLIGANTNVGDKVNVNQVSVRSSNSAGMIQTGDVGLTELQARMLLEIYRMYGLDPLNPLVVNTASRTAGSEITQQITTSPTQTVVTRV
jgi:hypothetical protein